MKKKKLIYYILNIFAAAASFQCHKSISAIGSGSTVAILICPHDLTAAKRPQDSQNTRHATAIALANGFTSAVRTFFTKLVSISRQIVALHTTIASDLLADSEI